MPMMTPPKESKSPLCHIVSPVGMLGYGIDAVQTDAALKHFTATSIPTAIILDSGSTDSGPQKLALGGMTVPKGSYVRDLQKLLALSYRYEVPLIFSSAGGSGTDHNTKELTQVMKDLAAEIGPRQKDLKIVTILSDIPKDIIKRRLHDQAIGGCGKLVPELTEADIDACPVIVAQMGPEPFLDALNEHPDLDVLVGGRAYDPAPFVAYASHCYQKVNSERAKNMEHLYGGFTHMGKILECAGLCAIPKGGGALSTVYLDGTFDICPMASTAKCTALSVAAHTLYEKSRPDKLYGPGGYLDLTKAEYKQLEDQRTVHISGGTFHWSVSDPEVGVYQVKLEGAKASGYRAMYVGAIRDPILIGQIDSFLDQVRTFVAREHETITEKWELEWHIYGKKSDNDRPEICIIGEALASTQELATSLVATAKVATIHGPYENQKATSGNLAHGVGGLYTVPLGPCAEFCVYHLMNLETGEERGGTNAPLFKFETVTIDLSKNTALKDTEIRNGDSEADGEKKSKKLQTNGHKALKPSLTPGSVLGDVAQVIRSKNSGPYEITFDIMFSSAAVYRAIKDADILNTETVSRLYAIPPEDVVWSGFFDQAQAYKATIPRLRGGIKMAAGGFMEDDVHGSQMYIPLLQLEIPEDLFAKLRVIIDKESS